MKEDTVDESQLNKSIEAVAAAIRIRDRAKAAKLGTFDWEEWKTYRDKGRL